MASAPKNRLEEYLKKQNLFRRNAILIIEKMLELSSGIYSLLVDEVLHGIFFLGRINTPRYMPTDILTKSNLLNQLRGSYPQPFNDFESKLPKRSPLSGVMDLIVEKTGRQSESEILKSLQEFILILNEDGPKELIASTVCVSQPNKEDNSTRYYGLSMSTSANWIAIAASCLSNWDEYVAGAVMTYYPDGKKKTYFDGNIRLPGQVRCQAFNLCQLDPIPPCKSCANLFGFATSGSRGWTYGNCAENESISNLLKHEKEVKEQAKPTSPTCTDANRREVQNYTLKMLNTCLENPKRTFPWDGTYYNPS